MQLCTQEQETLGALQQVKGAHCVRSGYFRSGGEVVSRGRSHYISESPCGVPLAVTLRHPQALRGRQPRLHLPRRHSLLRQQHLHGGACMRPLAVSMQAPEGGLACKHFERSSSGRSGPAPSFVRPPSSNVTIPTFLSLLPLQPLCKTYTKCTSVCACPNTHSCTNGLCVPSFEWQTGWPAAHQKLANEVKAMDSTANVSL